MTVEEAREWIKVVGWAIHTDEPRWATINRGHTAKQMWDNTNESSFTEPAPVPERDPHNWQITLPTPAPITNTLLREADQLINGDRQEAYGPPSLNHQATADTWSAYINRKFGTNVALTVRDVCWLHAFEKGIRDANTEKADNPLDAAGYMGNIGMDVEYKERLWDQ